MSSDEKLKLIQQIRQNQMQNTQIMNIHSGILNDTNAVEEMSKKPSTLFLRFLLSITLFIIYILLSTSNVNEKKEFACNIRKEITKYANNKSNIFDFVDDFNYTLNVKK